MQGLSDAGVPFGILTAYDLPGLTFVVAKLILAPRANGDVLAIDSFTRSVAHISSGAWNRRLNMPVAEAVGLLQSRAWDFVALRGHGDPSHACLLFRCPDRAILCAAIGEERALDGSFDVRGCDGRPASVRCKRDPDRATTRIPFHELRAHHLMLMTCNGFGMNGALYPSTADAVLSALDGNVLEALVPISTISTLDKELSLWTDAWLATGSLSILAELANDRFSRSESVRPYVLFGDPVRRPDTHQGIAAFREQRVRPGQVLTALLPPNEEPPIIDAGGAQCEWLTGRRFVNVHVPRTARTACNVSIVDRKADVDSLRECVRRIATRLASAARTERSVIRHTIVQWDRQGQEDIAPALRELVGRRHDLEIRLDVFSELVEAMARDGVWRHSWRRLGEQLNSGIAAWDKVFSDLLVKLLSERFHEFMWVDFVAASKTELRCERCDFALMSFVRKPVTVEPIARSLACPVCGPQQLWQEGIPRINARCPKVLIAGETALFDVEEPEPVPLIGDLPSAGRFAMMLLDKANDDAVAFTESALTVGGSRQMRVPIPSNMGSDSHVVLFALVNGLCASFCRFRCPSFVRPDSHA
jgi:hypothetical protein